MLMFLKKKQFSAVMLKLFLLVALLFPIDKSRAESVFAPDIVLANLFVLGFIVLALLEGHLDGKRQRKLVFVMAAFLLCFNLFAFYANATRLVWYAGQLNVSIAILFFLTWLLMKDSAEVQSEKLIKFLLRVALITNVIALAPYFLGYSAVKATAAGYEFIPFSENLGYSWLYHHKSEYSFSLVLFLALTVTYRHLIEKKWVFWASIAVYAVGLVIAGTRATMVAALFILVGVMADYLKRRAAGFSWKYLLWFLPVLVVGLLLLYKISKERNIWSLGSRTYIWKGGIRYILENPWGLGSSCGAVPFRVENVHFKVWNCHNTFLNMMLQFSIPAGFFFILIFITVVAASIWKNRSFTTLGIWTALLIPLNMDWCMVLGHVPLVLMLLYFIFFHPLRQGRIQT